MSYLRSRLFACFAILCLSALLPAVSSAQPAGAEGEYFLYRVQGGDTLSDLAQRYTGRSNNWRVLQSVNRVDDPYRLRIAREIRIPFALIPLVEMRARVVHVVGQAHVNGSAASVGGELSEGVTVRTGADGFITLQLPDDSALSITPHSVLHLARLRAFEGTGLSDVIVNMEDGELESAVAPHATGVGRFEVQTPVTITGVRGTRLRVRLQSEGSQTEVVSGRARLNTRNDDDAMLIAGQGAATDASGKMLGVRTLLPAPIPGAMVGEGGVRTMTLLPTPGASAYLVQVSEDAIGTRLYSSERFTTPEIRFRAPGPGTYYVRVRAIDVDGLMGEDTVRAFEGVAALTTPFGMIVSTRFAGPVLLGH